MEVCETPAVCAVCGHHTTLWCPAPFPLRYLGLAVPTRPVWDRPGKHVEPGAILPPGSVICWQHIRFAPYDRFVPALKRIKPATA